MSLTHSSLVAAHTTTYSLLVASNTSTHSSLVASHTSTHSSLVASHTSSHYSTPTASYYQSAMSESERAKLTSEMAGWFLGPLGVLPVLAIARWAMRLQTYQRLYEDDIALAIALVCSVSYGSIMSPIDMSLPYMIGSADADADRPSLTAYRVMQCVLFIGYAAVKFCFLFLYKDLFWVSVAFRRFWYFVLAWLVVSTVAIVGISLSTYGKEITISVGNGGYTSSYSSAGVGYTKPAICQYIDTIATLILIGVPVWLFPSLHLRHSINWWIAFVYGVAGTGWGFGLSGAFISYDETVGPTLGAWALYWQVAAAAFVGFTPLIIPAQRQHLWPWSKISKKTKDTESGGTSDSTSAHEDSKRKRRFPFGSMERLIHRKSGGKLLSSVDSFSTTESVEMADFRSSLQDVRQQRVLQYSHAQTRGLHMDI